MGTVAWRRVWNPDLSARSVMLLLPFRLPYSLLPGYSEAGSFPPSYPSVKIFLPPNGPESNVFSQA